ncbi:hypothetical protein D3C72_937310 [compost metagenome]
MNLRPGPETIDCPEWWPFQAIVVRAMATARIASISQVSSHAMRVGCCMPRWAATRAVRPIATRPQPGTAVKLAAAAIVSRMKARLAAARLFRGVGSGRSGRSG